MKKISIILLIMILLLNCLVIPVKADESPDPLGTGGIGGTDDTTDDTTVKGKVKSAINLGIDIASIIGAGVAVIILIIVAIKYMSAAPSDKAEIKKHMVVYVVGAVLLFSATGVLQIISKIGKEVVGNNNSSITTLMPDLTM